MLEKGLAIISESVLKISDDITKMDGFFKSPDDITTIVGQSSCKPLCCPPTLLTLPLKIRVPPANATHLYIIILQLLNILYGKLQILPNPHNTQQFKCACPATAHVHYFLLHVSHSDLISKEFINGVTVFNFLISPLKLQL